MGRLDETSDVMNKRLTIDVGIRHRVVEEKVEGRREWIPTVGRCHRTNTMRVEVISTPQLRSLPYQVQQGFKMN